MLLLLQAVNHTLLGLAFRTWNALLQDLLAFKVFIVKLAVILRIFHLHMICVFSLGDFKTFLFCLHSILLMIYCGDFQMLTVLSAEGFYMLPTVTECNGGMHVHTDTCKLVTQSSNSVQIWLHI